MEVSFLLDGLQAVSSSLHSDQKGNGKEENIYDPEGTYMWEVWMPMVKAIRSSLQRGQKECKK